MFSLITGIAIGLFFGIIFGITIEENNGKRVNREIEEEESEPDYIDQITEHIKKENRREMVVEVCKDCEEPVCIREDCNIWMGIRDGRAVDRYQEEKDET